MRLAVLLVLAGACGRIGFDSTSSDAAGDTQLADGLSPPGAGAVQHGMATLTNGTSLTVPITAVDPVHSFLAFQFTVAASDPSNGELVGQLVNGTELQFARMAAGPAISISWYVVTHPGLRVQRGNANIEPHPTIAPVDVSRAFPIISHATMGTDYNEDDYVRARLLDAQDFQLEVGFGTIPERVEWQLVEWNEVSVSRVDLSFQANDTARGVSQSGLDLAHAFMEVSWSTPVDMIGIGCNSIMGSLDMAVGLHLQRGLASCWGVETTSYVVRAPTMVVRAGIEPFTASEVTKVVNLAPVDMERSFVLLSGLTGATAYAGAAPDDDTGMVQFTADLKTSTMLTLGRASTRNAAANVAWFVVQLP